MNDYTKLVHFFHFSTVNALNPPEFIEVLLYIAKSIRIDVDTVLAKLSEASKTRAVEYTESDIDISHRLEYVLSHYIEPNACTVDDHDGFRTITRNLAVRKVLANYGKKFSTLFQKHSNAGMTAPIHSILNFLTS